MEKTSLAPLKLNVRRTSMIGFAFIEGTDVLPTCRISSAAGPSIFFSFAAVSAASRSHPFS